MSFVIQTLSERVFDIVREQIVVGGLASDIPIRQGALAKELGVSRIPVREALARLEQQGLLISHSNRGYLVRSMSMDEADEIFALRLALEPAAAALAAVHADDAAREEAQLLFERLDAAASHNLADVAVRNREFHTALVRVGERSLTTDLVERLSILSERYVVAQLEPWGRGSRACIEHLHLLNAWMARDGDTVERLLAGHIEATLVDLKMQFEVAV
ncbi:MAG TPA: GntR family transcriptional regulator [Sphingopyxis sp.]|uniref:GntR family transcriptional regulator n=1 Tax=Sphingopyxis sp. TaxID=1908224 RepID=UPI002B813483|nr:GntR family transcriptional regulator [Sphingopyxis sp.]HWW59673.1 GntR family transcriptional regulator [Sphingopyxis sp.]